MNSSILLTETSKSSMDLVVFPVPVSNIFQSLLKGHSETDFQSFPMSTRLNKVNINPDDDLEDLTITDSMETLNEIANLEDDWNGYGGHKMPESVIKLAEKIVKILYRQPEIFPTGRRSIQMQYELDDDSYLEFEIFDDRIHTMVIPQMDYSRTLESEIPVSEYVKLADQVDDFFHASNRNPQVQKLYDAYNESTVGGENYILNYSMFSSDDSLNILKNFMRTQMGKVREKFNKSNTFTPMVLYE